MAVRALENAVIVRIGVADRAHAIGSAVIGVEPGVIERRTQPTAGGVASGAGIGESRRDVVRIRRAAVVLRMAPVTVRGQSRVVVVHVATGAGHGRVRTCERKTGVVVIKRRLRPRGCVVAHITLLREPGRSVVRVVRIRVVGEMACNTSRIRQSVGIATGVALAALQRRVPSSERPAGTRVIERGRRPGGSVMAYLALLGEAYRHVIRIRCAGEILLMATVAGGRQAGVVVVYVALCALHAGVGAGKRKGRLGMIKRRRHPRRSSVADLAGLRNTGGRVVGICRTLVILQVT